MLFILAAAFVGSIFPAKAAELSADQLKAAQKLYVTKCTKCHERYQPQDYSKADWDVWMTKMNRKSRVKGEQAQLLIDYTELRRTGKVTDAKTAKH